MAVVLSTLALKGTLEALRPPGAELRFDATQAILRRLAEGERADLLILTDEALRALEQSGRVTRVQALGSSGIGLAVRAGAKKPDISTVETFKRSLMEASSVAQSKVGASGIYFSALLEREKIRLKKRVVIEKGPVGLAVAAGEAELGVQQLCELAPVPGIDIVGPLPAPLQVMTAFSAGIPSDAADAAGARALLELLASPRAREIMRASGLEPSP